MISPDYSRKLFKKEFEILETALFELAAGKYEHNELLPEYKALVASYEELLTLTRKTFKISDAQGRNLLKREGEIKNLLNNAGQGFLTFGKDLLVNREYSAECSRIFGQKIGKLNILTLLSVEDDEQNRVFAEVFRCIWQTEDAELQRDCISKLPEVININELYLSVDCKVITPVEGDESLVMLILTDITDKYKAQEQVAFLSYHDKLTLLYNRAYVEEWLSELSPQSGYPLSVIMADMNGLKLTNDVFGHAQGDNLLVRLAGVLLRCCRKTDIVARWGGDEFIVLLPGTDKDVCVKVCERIKTACMEEKGSPIELSVALGVATRQSPLGSMADLFSMAESRMYANKLRESKQVRRKIIRGLQEILNARCYETYGHAKRLEDLLLAFAGSLGYTRESVEMRHLSLLAGLHDIGKVAVSGKILDKPGPLTAGEWESIRSHSEIGFRMAQSIGETAVGELILAHHERWDGQGYPYGMRGEQIPRLARLFAIVDAYDVMTHDCPYREVLSQAHALKEIEKGSGTQFDPELAKAFMQFIAAYPH
ncbi:diguanylate cyclase [Desulfoscipio sp. XC116]|uniref:bifunctional diguanylate cyclase/phosphohydrolase n=1 Tax=Desulfoscipio sp. XC116 TaxID=3144975 RepID=UPI00325B0B47